MTGLKSATALFCLLTISASAQVQWREHDHDSGYDHPYGRPHGYSSANGVAPTARPSCGYPGGGPTATIDAGVVVGTTTSLPAATASVNKFLGVPFAQSPPERFAPPVGDT